MSKWFCYLIISTNDKYLNHSYIGITNDLERRLKQHNGIIKGGAKSIRNRGPFILVSFLEFDTKSKALKCEYQMKKYHGYNKRIFEFTNYSGKSEIHV